MGGDGGGGEAGAVADALDDAGDEGGAVELAHLLGHADVLVHDRVVVGDHVLVLVLLGPLERVGLPPEQVPPQQRRDQLQQRQDPRRPLHRPRRLPVQQQVEEA